MPRLNSIDFALASCEGRGAQWLSVLTRKSRCVGSNPTVDKTSLFFNYR